MFSGLHLAPRYRSDDELPWLEGIDPSRRYWIWVNGDSEQAVAIPGLCPESFDAFKEAIQQFRRLAPGESMTIDRAAITSTIHRIGENCYALADDSTPVAVWHLFDRDAMESLLMTAHPDWMGSDRDLELGRRSLMQAWQQTAIA
jgi:hypothetical protein